ncbi:MAG: transglutaminase domain-containing protein [Clostridia bacterium]|nr:transglutaminase domain-containing protein [Clostridia bacterium]
MEYIHPNDKVILDFAGNISQGSTDIRSICRNLLAWFDDNVAYSRLNAPFFPLQRGDLDVLSMKAGTCGDYSNLVVSVLSALNFDARYAYVHKDCYGDAQDHICAAVKEKDGYILVDATQPYRKWHGFNCPHQEYDLLFPHEFEQKMKEEEAYWKLVAKKHNNDLLAGLLYAPWIYSECVKNSSERFDNVFFLLSFNSQVHPTLYAYYQKYTEKESHIPIMAIVSKSETSFYFSIYAHNGLWDNAQWGQPYGENDIPDKYLSEELQRLKLLITKVKNQVNLILEQIGCCSLM